MKNEDSGSDYFASMTDMMIGILFIFVIMIAFFAFQINTTDAVPRAVHDPVVEENKRLKALIDQLEKPNPLETYLTKGQEVRNGIVSSAIRLLKEKGVDARSVKQGVITISGKGLFGSGRSDLDSVLGARDKVNTIAETLESQVACFAVSEEALVTDDTCNPDRIFVEAVFIEGHTDNIPVSTTLLDGSTSNLELSARRATNTYQQVVLERPFLTKLKNPFGQQALSAAAYGEQRPIADNKLRQGREDNRRIDIRLVMHVPQSIDALEKLHVKHGVRK